MPDILVLPTEDPSLFIRELATEADDEAYFEAVNFNPAHLSQFGDDIAEKYKTLEAVTRKRLESGNQIRMGMWRKDEDRQETFVGFVKSHARRRA